MAGLHFYRSWLPFVHKLARAGQTRQFLFVCYFSISWAEDQVGCIDNNVILGTLHCVYTPVEGRGWISGSVAGLVKDSLADVELR